MTTVVQHVRTLRLSGVVAAAGVLACWTALVAAPPGASAAGVSAVDCSTTNLQAAIADAGAGATLAVSGTCSGNFTIDKNLTLLGQGAAVLDGQGDGTTLTVSSGVTVRLTTLTITGGNASGNGLAGNGGGIRNFGTLRVDQSTVKNNSAAIYGGGIYNESSATLTLNKTSVIDNTSVVGGVGGGVYNSGGALTLVGSDVGGNTATYLGGGIYSVNVFGPPGGAPVTLIDTRIRDNSAASGGGIYNLSNTETLKNSALSGNSATYYGGGITNYISTTTLSNTTVTGNTARIDGGGIYNVESSLTLIDSTLSGDLPDDCAPGCTG